MNRIPELDGLRTVAIALVIGCHYQSFAAPTRGLSEFGWVGVDIFFVLSGYLITTILLGLRGRAHAYRIFYARRIRRILPPCYISLALCMFLGFLVTLRLDVRTTLIHLLFLTSFEHTKDVLFSAVHALWTHTAPSLVQHHPLPMGLPGVALDSPREALSGLWSLSVEEWFYIIWAPTVLIFGRRGIVAGSVTGVILGTFLRWASGVAGLDWNFEFFSRFDLLGIGSLLAVWFQVRNDLELRRQKLGDLALAIAGGVSLLCLAGILWHISPFLGREIRSSALFAAFGTTCIGIAVAALIAFLIRTTQRDSIVPRVFRGHPMVWIGRRSYTIYLAHLPWYWVVCADLHTIGRASWTATSVSLALTLLTAAVSWRFLEEPLLRNKRRQPEPAHV